MHDLNPFRERNRTAAAHIRARKVALHLHMRWTHVVHHNFALTMLVTPREDSSIRLLRSEPRLGAVRA